MDCRRPNPRSSSKRRKCSHDTCSVSQTLYFFEILCLLIYFCAFSMSPVFFFFFFDMPCALRCWHIPVLTVPYSFLVTPPLFTVFLLLFLCLLHTLHLLPFKVLIMFKTKKIYKPIIKLLLIKLFLYIF